MIDAKSTVKKPKDCNFITLHDHSYFNGIKIPDGGTNYVLWYKKSNPMHWGVTVKKFDEKEEFQTQYVWKLTWIYKDEEDILIPTRSSLEFTEFIGKETTAKLNVIKNKYLNKKK